MKTINFENPHGVIVQHDIATTLQRSAAFIIDIIVYYIAILLLYYILASLFEMEVFIIFILGILFFFLPLMLEVWTNGQSIGKIVLEIGVLEIDGKHFTRYVLKLIEISLSFGLLPIILFSFSKYRQSLGDKFAGTTVIIKKKSTRFSLKEIKSIQTPQEYTIEFPMVKRLHEKDVLLLKTILVERGAKNNEGVMKNVATKIKTLLKIEAIPYNDYDFLNKIITEYIILTR